MSIVYNQSFLTDKTNLTFSFPGKRRLEVRSDGARPFVPLDIHIGGACRNCRHHFAGADALRRPNTDRRSTVGNRIDHGQAACRNRTLNFKLEQRFLLCAFYLYKVRVDQRMRCPTDCSNIATLHPRRRLFSLSNSVDVMANCAQLNENSRCPSK